MRLVRFISSAGICSRRNAADLIKNNQITVNKRTNNDPAYIVHPTDVVHYKGKEVKTVVEMVYLMLNKPLGIICASSSPHGEQTVVDLVQDAYAEARLFPIGRLDKDTTGLILLTNDGDLAFKLSHPKFNISKHYRVTLNRQLEFEDEDLLIKGITLEDGITAFDDIDIYPNKKNTFDVALHSGKNRIIRRMFAELEYKIISLHRFSIGSLHLESLRSGDYRKLSEAEVHELKAAAEKHQD
jgi:23S rRNA pseudouridine2605 synthase